MAVVVETGEGIANANSCVSLADAQAFLDARELSVTLTDGHLLRAMDALDSVSYKGSKTHDVNALPMPRTSMTDCYGKAYDSEAVPPEFIRAQIWGAYHIAEGLDPAALATPAIKREKVDVLEVEYAVPDGTVDQVSVMSMPNVKHALRCLITNTGILGRA